MLNQVGLKCKCFPTVVASVRPGCTVRLKVCPQVGFVREAFLTDRAVVGLFSSVCPHVPLQQPGTGKGFATNVAVVARCVGSHVHREGGH